MSIEQNVFDKPTVVAGYNDDTVPVAVYVPAEARRPTAPAGPDPRRAALALALFVLVALVLASGAAAYAGWG